MLKMYGVYSVLRSSSCSGIVNPHYEKEVSEMSLSMLGNIIAITVYLGGMLLLGFRYTKASNSADEFYLGGRSLGPYVTAMSAEASDMSSWLLMGLPGLAYASGICSAFWTAAGLALGTYLNWLLVAKRLRHYSAVAKDSVTVPDFFENRFHDHSHLLMGISALVIVIFFIPYTASGFAACGKLFSSLFGVDYLTAMIVSAVVIVAYTAMGGFLAASTTDFVQSIVMSVALLVVMVFVVVLVAVAFLTVLVVMMVLVLRLSLFGVDALADFLHPAGRSGYLAECEAACADQTVEIDLGIVTFDDVGLGLERMDDVLDAFEIFGADF